MLALFQRWRTATSILLLAYLPSAFGSDAIAVIPSERGGAYDAVGAALRADLRTDSITLLQLNEVEALPGLRPRIAVAIGSEACGAVAASAITTAVLCALVPRAAFESISKRVSVKQRTLGAVLLDQPIARQLALLRLALPNSRQLGVLLGPESASLGSRLSAQAAEHGFRVVSAQVADGGGLFGALQRVLSDADVLLAVPDATIYNTGTLQNILRTTFHNRVPVMSFSPAYVRAGALLAVYSTPAQIGQQTARTVNAFIAGRPLPATQSPRDFEVTVNRNVARALSLQIPDDSVLAERLREMERSR
jgi:putative tryptophan/tyrosine transport system substrate-binding protein